MAQAQRATDEAAANAMHDPALSPAGAEQSRRAGEALLEALQGTDPDHLVVSPMRAALQTALAVLGPWITRPRPGRAAPVTEWPRAESVWVLEAYLRMG